MIQSNFKTLKRKDLQRLCKKYGLRANSTNSQMADSLVSFFKICEKNIQEEVERNAEKVLIILDKEEDEHDLNLKSCSGVSGDMEGAKVQWHEENSIIFLDEEDHEPVPVHTDELVQSEVDLTSSQILGSGASPNLASSSPKLLLLEWKGGQDGGNVLGANEPLSKHSNDELELGENLICRSSTIAGITMMEVGNTSDRKLSIMELDNASNDEVTKQLSPAPLCNLQDNYNSKERYCSIPTNHVRNLDDGECFIADELHHRCCAETPVSMHCFCLSSEQGCEVFESGDAEVRRIKIRLGCQDSEKVVGDNDRVKRNEPFKENEYHKENQKGSECQEGYSSKIIGSCDFEKVSLVILQDNHIVEKNNWDTSSLSYERTEEMNNNVGLQVNIERHDDHNLSILALNKLEKVGMEEFQVIVQKKEEDLKTLDGWFYEALEESVSTDLKDLTEAPKTNGNDVLTCQGLGLSGIKFQERVADYKQEKSENPQRFPDSQRQVEIKSGQIAPFEFNKRVDNVLEKLLCLTKVLRGEIPLVADSSLPCEGEISHEDCERNSTNSETLDGQNSIPSEQECAKNPVAVYEVESRDISMSRIDTFAVANPSEHEASVSRNVVDPIEEISRKLVKFCISSSRKPSKYNIINTPRIKSPGTFKHHTSKGNLRDKENTKSTELKNSSSKQKIRNSASAGSIRRPLRSVTNQMID